MKLNIKFTYKNKKKEKFNQIEDKVFELVKKGFENGDPFAIDVTFDDVEMQIEFGNRCCNIQIANEEAGETYGYINSEETDAESEDLYVNSYPKNLLCYNVGDILQMFKTFVEIGKPDEKYKWDIYEL